MDIDLLSTSKLSPDNRRVAEGLPNSYYSAEHSLTEYITALEMNLDANEQLKNKYTVADSIVGGLAGLSSHAVIFATGRSPLPSLVLSG